MQWRDSVNLRTYATIIHMEYDHKACCQNHIAVIIARSSRYKEKSSERGDLLTTVEIQQYAFVERTHVGDVFLYVQFSLQRLLNAFVYL